MKSTTAFDDQFSEEPDDTLARTGNTSKEQDMFAAVLEAGEANAKNNAAIRAASSSVAPGDAQDGDRMTVLYVAGAICRHLDMALDQSKVMAAARDIAQHIAAPAAGDARDAERLDWLEKKVVSKGMHGLSFDFVRHVEDGQVLERGVRIMWRHHLGERHPTIRAAIDEAMAASQQQEG